MVTVFRVEAKVIEPSYAIPGYLEALYVSDDGRTVIAVETLIIRGHERDQPAVRVWSGGRLTQTLFMKDLLGWRWPSKTVTGSAWGHPLGFKGDHQFDLQLAIGGKYEVKF